jgi:hypothetical protein
MNRETLLTVRTKSMNGNLTRKSSHPQKKRESYFGFNVITLLILWNRPIFNSYFIILPAKVRNGSASSHFSTRSFGRDLIIALMMEARSNSEAAVKFYETILGSIPESYQLYTRRRKNLKSDLSSLPAQMVTSSPFEPIGCYATKLHVNRTQHIKICNKFQGHSWFLIA